MGANVKQTLRFLLSAAVLTGCSRAPQPEICPTLQRGALVITELRGPQAGGVDTYGQWMELFNTTDAEVDMYGLRISWREKDGGNDFDILVRESLLVAPNEYVVLGHHEPGAIRDFVDYSFFGDHFKKPNEDSDDDGPSDEDDDEPEGEVLEPTVNDLHDEGILELATCEDEIVDRLVYDDLPATGSFSLGLETEPDADSNDDLSAWCSDLFEPAPEPDAETLEFGAPGSPGEANRPCP